MQREHIEVKGHIGTWYVLSEFRYKEKTYYILEHEFYGDEAPHVCVDSNNNLILEDIWNGKDDVYEYFESEGI